ncbi:MAG: hypothetical protein R3F59_10480 [Myxococcota bacterium]
MRRNLLILAVLGLFAAAGAWWLRSDGASAAADDPKLLANRVWAERAPRDDRDMVLYFVPIQIGSKRSGVMQRSSRYAFGGELFAWSREGDALLLDVPQRARTFKVPVRTWKCGTNEAPKGFDLCLELGSGDEKVRLYSRKGWRMPKPTDLPAVAMPLSQEALPSLEPGCPDCREGDVTELRELLAR